MLEILAVIAISRKIAAMMKEKNRSAAGYIVLFVLLWFGGEIMGAIVGFVAFPPRGANEFELVPYLFALAGAAIGGGIGFAIAAAIPPGEDPIGDRFREFDDEDDYERDRRRRRRRLEENDDEDDAPPRRRSDDGAIEESR